MIGNKSSIIISNNCCIVLLVAFLFAGGNATSVFNNNGDLVLAPTTSNNTVIINNDIVFDGSSLRDIIQQLLAETAELRSALRWSTFNLPSDHPISDFPSEFGGNLPSACAVYFNDAVYVFEGNSTARYLLNTSDMRGTWSILADMPMNLIQCSAIAFDSRIWIVSGMKSNPSCQHHSIVRPSLSLLPNRGKPSSTSPSSWACLVWN